MQIFNWYTFSRLDRTHLRRYREYCHREILRWVQGIRTVQEQCTDLLKHVKLGNHFRFVIAL